MAKADGKRLGLKDRIKQYEYEAILIIFLLLRFTFKNILGFTKYFTDQPIFGLSNTMCIVIGAVVLLAVCFFLASIFARLIRKNGIDFEKPILILTAFFFACPATLPFLFKTDFISGTQMLYPFALFVLSVFLIGKPVVEWLLPIICAIYFIPALYTKEIFFTILSNSAILYVPLILLFLFFDTVKGQLSLSTGHKRPKTDSVVLLIITLVISAGSYFYTLNNNKLFFGESFSSNEPQKINGYLLVCLLITAPLLISFSAVLIKAVKNKYNMLVFDVYWRSQILIFLLFKSNYYTLWIPFVVITLSSVVFYSVWQKNSAMIAAVRTIGDYFLERKFLLYIILISMASLSNVSSSYLSDVFLNIFSKLPF